MPPDAVRTSMPHGRTARRLEWQHLPRLLREEVERRCGSPVVEADSRTTGFTPGFASVLTCEDGSRHFVKAASVKAQRVFAEAYRAEARTLAALPAAVPAPRLLWAHDADSWVVLCTEHVDARHPRRPWHPDELAACLALTAEVAAALTPAPAGLAGLRIERELAGWPAYWDRLRALPAELPAPAGPPGLRDHAAEAARLASGFAQATAGDTLAHTDVRDDNLLLAADGRVLLCDWSWPVVAAPWVDTVLLLVGARGDGLEVEGILATAAVARDVPPGSIDALLALVAGYFLTSAAQPVPSSSPYLREVQRWQGESCWRWLAERRGWDLGG